MSIQVRKSEERGGANHGWLNTKHTFSFANYYDSKFGGYGPLRVINEDHVTPGDGFPAHPHRDFEIFSYVLQGGIRHKDSMGNTEVCRPGDIQFTSAGSGIFHSEFSEPSEGPLHFLQIWVKPSKTGLPPSYCTKTFPDEKKLGKLCLCLSETGEQDSIKIHQDVKVYASKLKNSQQVQHEFLSARKGYVHVPEISSPLLLKGEEESILLQPGDGAFLSSGRFTFENEGNEKIAHFILFDLSQ